MELLKLSDDGIYLGITSTVSTVSIRHDLLKRLIYNNIYDTITLVLYRNHTVLFKYTDTEDPDNPGNLFADLDAMWEWFMNVLNGSNIPDSALTTTAGDPIYDTNGEIVTN